MVDALGSTELGAVLSDGTVSTLNLRDPPPRDLTAIRCGKREPTAGKTVTSGTRATADH